MVSLERVHNLPGVPIDQRSKPEALYNVPARLIIYDRYTEGAKPTPIILATLDRRQTTDPQADGIHKN